jgi:hypothetical protein
MSNLIKNNVIPPITDPMGKYWRQPDTSRILIDDTHALMEKSTFEALSEYSSSIPSGIYPGKMWRCHHRGTWFLRWFGEHYRHDLCDDGYREILQDREILVV